MSLSEFEMDLVRVIRLQQRLSSTTPSQADIARIMNRSRSMIHDYMVRLESKGAITRPCSTGGYKMRRAVTVHVPDSVVFRYVA